MFGTKAAESGKPRPDIYVYRGYRNAIFAAADHDLVIACFRDEATFDAFFAGGARYGGWFSAKFLGVWGARNAARFRRLMTERHGEFRIVDTPPPSRHSGNTSLPARLSRLERQGLERTIKEGWPLVADRPTRKEQQ